MKDSMNQETERRIFEIHETVVKGAPSSRELIAAARAVVDARHYNGDDGWDRLKNAICELEGILEKSK